jgi:cell volume regulation protein A
VILELELLAGSVLVLLAIFASKLAGRLGVPALLLFLGLGMLAGSDGPGGIDFSDAEVAQAIGIGALALILFDGGLSTSWTQVRPIALRGAALATVGVAVTASVVGVAAAAILDVPIEVGLLLGAIVSSTDAAAVFAILRSRQAGLRGGVQPTLELESGANDPMAALLTITMIEVITGDGGSALEITALLVVQLAVGALIGLAVGWLARTLVNHLGIGSEGLYPVLTLAVAMGSYAGASLVGGSGFIAVYLCGLYLGNQELLHRNSIIRFHDAVAWLSQIAMFLVLGLLVFPSRLPEVAGSALLVAVVLAFVARPLGTFVCLLPFRVDWRQQAVIAWVGLRGATPIILATFPLVEGIAEAELIFDVVFFVVLTSVLVQGTTLEPVARLFGVTEPYAARPPAPLEAGAPLPDGTALRQVHIPAGSYGDGRPLVGAGLPPRALIVLVERGGTYIVPTGATRLEAGDAVLILADDDAFAGAHALLTAPAEMDVSD